MPQVVVCRGCGYLLYKDVEVKPVEEVIKHSGGCCPMCGKRLVFTSRRWR